LTHGSRGGKTGASMWSTGARIALSILAKHLRILREAGLVRVRPEAQRRVYELDPAPLAKLADWLAPYRAFWEDRLDALGRHLDDVDPQE
jgi:DNA-binding transcriptional ArsR family regulator